MTQSPPLKPMPWQESLVLFGLPTIVLYLVTRLFIPYLRHTTTVHPALIWFLAGGILVFIPLFLLSLLLFKRDNFSLTWVSLRDRFRLQPMNKTDWIWALSSLAAIYLGMGLIMLISFLLARGFGLPLLQTSPPFLHFEPFRGSQLWLFLVWAPFFFFNIFGEEFMWRGYILPRQELVHGRRVWIVHSLWWTLFHAGFGWNLIVLVLPFLFIQTYAVYKRKNTWVGIVIHALGNGPTFILVALGMVR